MGYCGEKFSQMAQTIRKTKGWGILSQSKSLFILNFWNCAEDDLTATDQHWSPRWQWKDIRTEMWLCPSPGLMWRCEDTCIFLEGREWPLCVQRRTWDWKTSQWLYFEVSGNYIHAKKSGQGKSLLHEWLQVTVFSFSGLVTFYHSRLYQWPLFWGALL